MWQIHYSYKAEGWFEVYAKIGVMALIPPPFGVVMTLIFLEVSPYLLSCSSN
jgi:hypothetical protein